MKPEIKYFQKFVIDSHLFTPVVRLAIFLDYSSQILRAKLSEKSIMAYFVTIYMAVCTRYKPDHGGRSKEEDSLNQIGINVMSLEEFSHHRTKLDFKGRNIKVFEGISCQRDRFTVRGMSLFIIFTHFILRNVALKFQFQEEISCKV